MSPTKAPPRARRTALRSKPAMIALRTLMLSNGLMVVFSGNQRNPPPGMATYWPLYFVTAVFSSAEGGGSPPIRCEPDRIWRDDTDALDALVRMRIEFR